MNTLIQNIKKISLILFVITGIIHFGSSIFIANQYYFKPALIVNKTMDIPFILTGLLYGLSSIRLLLTKPDKDRKVLDIALSGLIVLILTTIIIINLAVPDLYS